MRRVELTPDAVRQFKALPKAVRSSIKQAMAVHLVREGPTVTTTNKFRLRRASEHADYELRVRHWRVFYRVERDCVIVTLLGEKRGNALLVDREELVL
jgi:mRNA-degrading endonuclease RelE of RelBE toxin-antitoxin system